MSIRVRELIDGNCGCILECTTSGEVFGFVFDAMPEGVEAFLADLKRLGDISVRCLHDEGTLAGTWNFFRDTVFECRECGEKGDVHNVNLELSSCGHWFCFVHVECVVIDLGTVKLGHECVR